MTQPPRLIVNPREEEQVMFAVHDAFDQLLEKEPAKARQLAKELHDVAQRYAAPQPDASAGQTHIKRTRYSLPNQEH